MNAGRVLGIALLGAYVAATAAGLLALNHYVFALNATNHTAIPLEAGAVCLAGNAALAVGALRTGRVQGRVTRGLLALLAAVALLGVVELAVWDCTGTMTSYERWVAKGMPER